MRHFLVLLSAFASIAAFAQTPSAAQIQQFNALPQAQKEALARQFGIDIPKSLTRSAQPVVQPVDIFEERAVSGQSGAAQDEEAQSQERETLRESTTEVEVQENPLKRLDGLQPFGYNLFASRPSTFAPVGAIPVPENYTLGPGDELRVATYGQEQAEYQVFVQNDGSAIIPDVGPVSLQGLQFDEARRLIVQQIEERKIGVSVTVTLGELRSIQIFVLGEVAQPGSFAVSPFSSVLNALFVAGGITENGSLRQVQLKREGKTVANLDLYQLLLQGDISGDQRVQNGDVIFVTTVGSQVAIKGEVKRPAIFEIKANETLADVVDFASGFSGYAFANELRVRRTENGETRISRSLTAAELPGVMPRAGDEIEVLPVDRIIPNAVELAGLVERPGLVQWTADLTLQQLLTQAGLSRLPSELMVVWERQVDDQRALQVRMQRVTELLGAEPVSVKPTDRITLVPVLENQGGQFSRKDFFSALARRIENATPIGARPALISVQGVAASPGPYPLVPGMDAAEILSLAELDGEPSSLLMVLERRATPDQAPTIEVARADTVLQGAKQFALNAGDRLAVVPLGTAAEGELGEVKTFNRAGYFAALATRIRNSTPINELPPLVQVNGAVRIPGLYPLTQNASLQDLLLMGGGFAEFADRQQFELIQRVELGFRVEQLNFDPAVVVNPGSEVIVRTDREQRNLTTVSIEGFVRFPGSYRMPRGSRLSDLIERAGGVLPEADLEAAVFSRQRLRDNEAEQLERLTVEAEQALIQQNLEARDLTSGTDETATEGVQDLVDQISTLKPAGRLVVNLPAVLVGQTEQDVLLEPGDNLIIPNIQQSISVLGSVLYPTSHVFEQGLTPLDYIERSGGYNARADEKRVFVVRANGRVEPLTQDGWLSRDNQVAVGPGDTIVIPQDFERVNGLNLWSSVTSIVYQAAVTLAVVNGL